MPLNAKGFRTLSASICHPLWAKIYVPFSVALLHPMSARALWGCPKYSPRYPIPSTHRLRIILRLLALIMASPLVTKTQPSNVRKTSRGDRGGSTRGQDKNGFLLHWAGGAGGCARCVRRLLDNRTPARGGRADGRGHAIARSSLMSQWINKTHLRQ